MRRGSPRPSLPEEPAVARIQLLFRIDFAPSKVDRESSSPGAALFLLLLPLPTQLSTKRRFFQGIARRENQKDRESKITTLHLRPLWLEKPRKGGNSGHNWVWNFPQKTTGLKEKGINRSHLKGSRRRRVTPERNRGPDNCRAGRDGSGVRRRFCSGGVSSALVMLSWQPHHKDTLCQH